MIGETISHYRILEELGRGGMGVVYKAQDLKLDRIVALKFLPHHLTTNEAEQARFLQEAKAASALNHPNVCSIHSIGEHEGPAYAGAPAGKQSFIDMELVEGQTLRAKIASGTLKPDDAITYAIQVGDALHEAHSKGVVHRDIKCENIMLNLRNQIKVMDFGLAKLKGSLKLTKSSSTVGTLSYMAPEQIQGKEIDGRADIFSFGVVLFEMLTAHMPFRGEHDAAIMYSILNEEPEPLTKYLPDASSELLHIINRALEKNQEDRYQTVNDMIIDLRRTRKDTGKVSRRTLTDIPVQPAASVVSQTTQASIVSSSRRTRIVVGGLATVAVLAVVLWLLVLRPSGKLELNPNMTFRTLQIPFQEVGFPGLSRDGGWVAFAGNADGKSWDVYLMNTGSGEPRQITTDSTGFMQTVSLSPDGSQIVYDRADKGFTKPEIAIVSSLGGFSKRIVNLGFGPKWRPDGQRIGYVLVPQWGSKSGKSEFRSVKPNGSDDRLEFADSLDVSTSYSWSPDGKEICWTRRTPEGHYEIFVRNLESGQERQVTSLKKNTIYVCWTQNNQIIFSSDMNGNNNLWMVSSSGGTPVQITRGSGPDVTPVASADGKRLLFTQTQSTGKIWLASLQGGNARQLTFDDVNIANPSFSSDGRKVIYVLSTPKPSGSSSALFVLDLSTMQRTQLLSDESNIHSPKWSPDGKWIAYAAHPDSIQHDSSKTYVLDSENLGSPLHVGSGIPELWINDVSFLTSTETGSWICTIDGATMKRYFRDSTYSQPVLDGKYIVYGYAFRLQKPGAWIEPAPSSGIASGPRLLIKSLASFAYDPTTKSLYYVSTQNDLRRISLPDGKEEIVQGTFPNLRVGMNLSISPDGKHVTYLDEKEVRKLVLIENLLE